MPTEPTPAPERNRSSLERHIGIDIACIIGTFLIIGIVLGLAFGAWECLVAVVVIIAGIGIFLTLMKITNMIMKGKL